ncbi:MAG: Alpha-glucosidase [Bacteroidetes bacterium]|nr:Alpha-glucosidase [Bacteroidota bacterium]
MKTPFCKKVVLVSSAILFIWIPLAAQWTSIGNVSAVEKTGDGIILSAPPAKVQITVLDQSVLRVRMDQDGQFAEDRSWAVVKTDLGPRTFTVDDAASEVVLKTSKLTLRVTKNPCRLAFYDAQGNLVNQDDPGKGMAWSGNQVSVWKTMPLDEQYFGFGEKAGALNRKWKTMSMWNTDIPAYRADTDPLYETIPFFYGTRKGKTYGIFFDNTYYSTFNMGKEHQEQYSFGAVDGELNYYFIYGPQPKDVLGQFSQLVGRMPLPPKWAVAYQQCRYSYYPEARVREIARTFRQKQIPCDVIYLDIHYMDEYRCFTWDKTRFPNPKKMIDDLSKDGFKVVVIIDPGIKNEPGYWVYDEGVKADHFVKWPDGRNYVGKVWPGDCVFPDFTKTEARDWWGTLYKGLLDDGVKGFWNDMNEPAVFDVPMKTFDLNVMHDDAGQKTDHRKNHNVYGMQMARGTFEGVSKLRPNERPFVLTRANYAGGNRYAAAWTGDNISSWEHLEMAVPMCLNLSISGQPFVGTDIGGFVGSPSGELYTRWLQLGAFTPLMRTHTEIGSADQEPWSYGPKFEAINKKSIELLYKLLPYVYTQFYLASTTRIPIMRPMFLDFTTKGVYLPKGEWYNYWTGEKLVGPKWITADAPIDRIPLFAKGGAIIPTQQVLQYSDQALTEPLTFEIYPASEATSVVYEDDGNSLGYVQGDYLQRTVFLKNSDKSVEVIVSAPQGNYRPSKQMLLLKVNDAQKQPSSVTMNGKLISRTAARKGTGWRFDAKTKTVWIAFEDAFREYKARIHR